MNVSKKEVGWVRCPSCGHKLFWLNSGNMKLEVKCHSCKSVISVISYGSEVDFKAKAIVEKERKNSLEIK